MVWRGEGERKERGWKEAERGEMIEKLEGISGGNKYF
jgi:hypothetical protein